MNDDEADLHRALYQYEHLGPAKMERADLNTIRDAAKLVFAADHPMTDTSNAELIARLRANSRSTFAGDAMILCGEAADALAAADARIAELEADQLRADDHSEALLQKIGSLSAHETCGCSYDRPDDICMHHSPKLAAALAQARRDALEEAALEAEAQMYMSDRPRTPRDAAAAIRALSTKEPGQ